MRDGGGHCLHITGRRAHCGGAAGGPAAHASTIVKALVPMPRNRLIIPQIDKESHGICSGMFVSVYIYAAGRIYVAP